MHFYLLLFYDGVVKKILLVLAIILLVALISGILYWYFVLSKQPTSETPGATAKPTPDVGFGSLRPYAYLCVNFQKVDYKISCEKAVELALAQAQGKVKNVSVGSVRTSVPSSSGGIERQTVNMWLIDIVLAKPYFDDKFNKQINILQVGIRVDEHNLIYKKPLE